MKFIDSIKLHLDNKFGRYGWYEALKSDYCFRTVTMSAVGTVVTIAFAIYNGIFGVINHSVWYGSFAAYLIILAIQRFLVIVVYRTVSKKCGDDAAALKKEKLKIYLANGAIFVPITVALSVIVALLLTAQRPILSDEILAIATAAYAFYKIIAAIINFNKAHALKDPVIQTIKNAALVDALVSVIMLEGTLITTFGTMDYDMFVLIGISGLGVALFTLAIGLYMIITAAKKLKSSGKEEL